MNTLEFINTLSAKFFESIHNPELTKAMVFLTDIGSPQSIFMYCLVIIMLMWFHKKTDHLVQFVLTLATASLVTLITKALVKLPRPAGGLIFENGYSFASGHAMIAAVFFTLILYSYKDHIQSLALRRLFIFLNILAILVVGLSRVYLGVHYMTDVLAGFTLGALIACVSIVMHQRHRRAVI